MPSDSLGVAQQNLWVPTDCWIVDDVAVMLESFYKPELDAAHNVRCGPAGQPLACGVIIPEIGQN
jgi:hypothetical protein